MNMRPETLRLCAVIDRTWAADEKVFFSQVEAVARELLALSKRL